MAKREKHKIVSVNDVKKAISPIVPMGPPNTESIVNQLPIDTKVTIETQNDIGTHRQEVAILENGIVKKESAFSNRQKKSDYAEDIVNFYRQTAFHTFRSSSRCGNFLPLCSKTLS